MKKYKIFLKANPTVNDLISIYQYSECESFDDLVSNTSETVLSEMTNNTAFAWANILISSVSIFADFLDKVAIEDTLYPQKFEYCIGDYDYETYICKENNTKYKLVDLRKYILNNASGS